MRSGRWTQASTILGVLAGVLLVLWAAYLIRGVHLTTAEWGKILPGMDLMESDNHGPEPAEWAARVAGKFLGLLTVLLGGSALLVRYQETLRRPEVVARLVSGALTLAVAGLLIEDLTFRGAKGSWYDVQAMMTHPETVPVFGQRLLLIWPAMLLKYLRPGLGYMTCFVLIQSAAIALAVWVYGQWSALFVGAKLKGIGQVLMAAWVLPNSVFFQAHDIGVILMYGLCFWFLYKRQYWLFLIAFSVGVLNHQNILLLIPTSMAVMWGRERFSTLVRVAGIATAAYFSIQYVLNKAIPIPLTHEYGIWVNMDQIMGMHRTMIYGFMLTLAWFAGAAAAFRYADPFLQRASILLPMQIGMFFVFGRLNEARLFHGFLPVLIGIYLCYFRAHFQAAAQTVAAPRTESMVTS